MANELSEMNLGDLIARKDRILAVNKYAYENDKRYKEIIDEINRREKLYREDTLSPIDRETLMKQRTIG